MTANMRRVSIYIPEAINVYARRTRFRSVHRLIHTFAISISVQDVEKKKAEAKLRRFFEDKADCSCI